ncbi:Cys-tRNA(Pro) deacylase [Nostocoides jenkinsii]|uniref:Cys-tRNA(Pro)/Cys-tRNA(Cys) deacylase n=1 Tax=Nostocoides jenkinsii Ben 74 TaxID=1193518 RepID=A0A077M722_9MICO|nr:Cys-tRNA(Pro) deacylase [Tetrasphaera jenkinsii]CCI53101.1 conserved hypothetical protein [Tetrasphaera jenkinsii Ben 74]
MAKPSSGTPATVALTKAGVSFSVHAYEHDPAAPAYGLEAAAALGLDPDLVFKTLLVDLDGGREKVGVGIVPVNRHLDLKAIAAACGAKRASMCDPATAQRLTGYVVGGISPIGPKRLLPTVLDESAAERPTIYVSGGRRGLDVGLSPADLLLLTRGAYAAIAR